jgi:hypothetical protein
MIQVGVVALDGAKLASNAADVANRTLAKLHAEVAQILKQAAEADQRENEQHGTARGDELPAALASKADRLARLRQPPPGWRPTPPPASTAMPSGRPPPMPPRSPRAERHAP